MNSKLRVLSSRLSETETRYGLSVMEISEYMWLKQVMWARYSKTQISRILHTHTHTHTHTQGWKITEPNIHKISLRNIIKRKYGWCHFFACLCFLNCLQWTCIIENNVKMFCKKKNLPIVNSSVFANCLKFWYFVPRLGDQSCLGGPQM